MKLVVLLGIVCLGLAVQEVSAMSVMAGANLPSLNLLATIISKIQQIIISFVQGVIAALNNTKPPSINTGSYNTINGVRYYSGDQDDLSPNSGSYNNYHSYNDDDDDDQSPNIVTGNNIVFGNNSDDDDDDESSNSDLNFDGVKIYDNKKAINVQNNGNNRPAAPNGLTSKYGNIMTHIPTISQAYGRIVKLEKLNEGKNGIKVILLRENNGISTYFQKGPISDLKIENKKDGVLVTFKRNGKQESVTYK